MCCVLLAKVQALLFVQHRMERSMIIAAWIAGIVVMPFVALGIAQVFMCLIEGVFTLFSDLVDLISGGR